MMKQNVYKNQDNTENNYIVVLVFYIKYVDDRVSRDTILSKQDYYHPIDLSIR